MKFAVIGDDARQQYLANKLEKDLYQANYIQAKNINLNLIETKNTLSNADIIVAPNLKNQKLDIEFLIASLKKNAIFFAGLIPEQTIKTANENHVQTFDYFKSESLATLNAIPTAEGALMIAMSNKQKTMFGSRCLVTGYGKVASRLAKLLYAVGANVTVAARSKKDLSNAFADHLKTIELLKLHTKQQQFDFVFNSIPSVIIDKAVLNRLNEDCEIIDISSNPGGVDFDYAKKRGIKAELHLALPSKVAPETAAEYIKKTLFETLKERGIYHG